MFKKTIEVKYSRIKKPKKDEFLIFHLVDEPIDSNAVNRFKRVIERAIQDKKCNYLILSGEIEIHKMNKKGCRKLPTKKTKSKGDDINEL